MYQNKSYVKKPIVIQSKDFQIKSSQNQLLESVDAIIPKSNNSDNSDTYNIDIENESINLAINTLQMSLSEYNLASIDELLSIKQNYSNVSKINSINILIHYKNKLNKIPKINNKDINENINININVDKTYGEYNFFSN